MPADITFSQALSIVQAAGVAGVLTVALLAFLRGWVVPADIYHRALDDIAECRRSNDALRDILRRSGVADDAIHGQGSGHFELHGSTEPGSAQNRPDEQRVSGNNSAVS